ncbi:MAG: glycine/betaine ABC transporter ATP-binding protein, partial [Nitrospinae bacterium]|nr:glycine/betaine ABC transporter ATP-binding protein [Nitrospinota bacterium]
RPATDYVREFVREVKRGRILKTGDVMWPPDEAATGPTISRDAVLQDALPVSMESEYPLRVVDETGAMVGVLSRSALLRGLTDRGGEM